MYCTPLHISHSHTHIHTEILTVCIVCYTTVLLQDKCIRQQFNTGKQTPQAVSQNSSGPYQADHHYNAVLQLHFVEK